MHVCIQLLTGQGFWLVIYLCPKSVRLYFEASSRSPEGTLSTISVLLKRITSDMSGPSSPLNFALWSAFSLIFKMDFAFLCNCSIILVNIYFLSPLVGVQRPKKLLVPYTHNLRAEFWSFKMTNIPSTQG